MPAEGTPPEAVPAPRVPESGWSRARRLRRRGQSAPRTSVPAREAPGAAAGSAPAPRSGPEGNIVRGED
ncbi:hypothetical protein ACFWNK_33565 [Streptomyces sp. NPDC058417]|uniref:hypothetical protein n=1 Tax=unclassified Streptomyces TaxID=2593676 RepID=UPI0036469857